MCFDICIFFKRAISSVFMYWLVRCRTLIAQVGDIQHVLVVLFEYFFYLFIYFYFLFLYIWCVLFHIGCSVVGSSFSITMNLVWRVSVFVLCIGAFTAGALRPNVVKVGAIFTFSTINGKVARIAMKAAEDDVNSDPINLGGTKLSILMHDSNFSGLLSIIGALKYMETDTVAIIGPQNAVMAHVLSHIANELHVPLLSFTALDPTLSPLQYPYFVQTAPNDQFQMSAIADMISYFHWREVIAVYSDDDQSRNGVIALGDKLAERRCKISYKAALPPDPTATRSEIKDQLVKLQMTEARVIILHTFAKTGLLVVDEARNLGMMDTGYVWIATTWLSTVLDSTLPLSSKTADSIQGVLTLRPHTPDSERKRAFMSRWHKLSNGSIGLNPYGLYAYDTVWMLTRAMKLFLDQGGNMSFSNSARLSHFGGGALNLGALSIFDGGKQLLNNILQLNVTGVTGPIQFNSDRSPFRPSYDILNVIKNGCRTIGYWSNYSGLSVVTPETLYARPPNRSSSSQHSYHLQTRRKACGRASQSENERTGQQMVIGMKMNTGTRLIKLKCTLPVKDSTHVPMRRTDH
ncbi:hypothetical protein I3760_06G116500 [Carya illinoinensis]|uniref:Receptor ligand binding region domain-containing protein n=1 Tax=Carya illinoinensis TaxID=32201 RepID=A0A922EUP9_CARIL|nr:hypothetical protein I3760_06G116500 [Carya illinoinensis]KAG6709105.1 hypothetical protein I3842_06G115500 [Carya illinoinensis]